MGMAKNTQKPVNPKQKLRQLTKLPYVLKDPKCLNPDKCCLQL